MSKLRDQWSSEWVINRANKWISLFVLMSKQRDQWISKWVIHRASKWKSLFALMSKLTLATMKIPQRVQASHNHRKWDAKGIKRPLNNPSRAETEDGKQMSPVSKKISCYPLRVIKKFQFEHKRSSLAQLVWKICMFQVNFERLGKTGLYFHLFTYFHSCRLPATIGSIFSLVLPWNLSNDFVICQKILVFYKMQWDYKHTISVYADVKGLKDV